MRLDWNNLTVKLVSCGYSRWESGVRESHTWSRRVIPDNDLWVFDAGKCSMDMLGGKTWLGESSILWMRPGHTYAVDQDPDDPIGHDYFHFELLRPDGSKFYPTLAEIPETFDCFNHAQWTAMAYNLVRITEIGMQVAKKSSVSEEDLHEDIFRTGSEMLKAMLMGIDLCDEFGKGETSNGNSGSRTAIQAAQLLDETKDPFLEIRTLARHFSLSRNRFTKIFTDFWKIPPQEYLINVRIRRAKSLLENSGQSIREISSELGYSDPFFFSRQFRERTGVTPGAYRKSHWISQGHIG